MAGIDAGTCVSGPRADGARLGNASLGPRVKAQLKRASNCAACVTSARFESKHSE